MIIQWIGQAGFIIQIYSKRIAIDPYLSNSCEGIYGVKRMIDVPIKPESLKVDWILCTHNHEDHTDPGTLPRVAKLTKAKFTGPLSSCKKMQEWGISDDRILSISRWQTLKIDEILVEATYAKHTEDSVGYIFFLNHTRFYITGDTEYFDPKKRIKAQDIDILAICINGKAGNMNINEAVKFTKQIQPRVVIPDHYGMFKENTVDVQDFLCEMKNKAPAIKVKILKIMQPYTYP